MHREAAAHLTEMSPPDEIAFHLSQGTRHAEAARQYLVAAKMLYSKGAGVESIGFLKQGIAELDQMTDAQRRDAGEQVVAVRVELLMMLAGTAQIAGDAKYQTEAALNELIEQALPPRNGKTQSGLIEELKNALF